MLPTLATIPEDIETQLRDLIHHAPETGTEAWLRELVQNSGHLTTPEYLRWRVIALIWLATRFNTDWAWPYLMWLNMNEPVMAAHLAEIVDDGVEELQCHVQLANWIAALRDERLVKFFSGYNHSLPAHKLGPLFSRLINQPAGAELGVWLAGFCRDTAGHPSPQLRPWRLFAAAWYATCFNPAGGLVYLQQAGQGATTLTAADRQSLVEVSQAIKAMPLLVQWIAACPDPAVKTMLAEVSHPDLAGVVAKVFSHPPDYEALAGAVDRAPADALIFHQIRKQLEQAGVQKQSAHLLDLACGPLLAQTLLFHSAGYRVTGVDLHLPPRYLPVTGLKQRFLVKPKYVRAWQAATAPYYEALARQMQDMPLRWRGVKVELADLTRLRFGANSFEAALCVGRLHYEPDVAGLLAEAARVLKPNGLLWTNIRPYAGLDGDFLHAQGLTLNRWSEAQYRAAIESHFIIDQWLAEPDQAAGGEAELRRRQIMVAARKK